jgi:hypothetical protein
MERYLTISMIAVRGKKYGRKAEKCMLRVLHTVNKAAAQWGSSGDPTVCRQLASPNC